ncbi:hypothetical protein [Streptomyces sp. GbtcB6]|uniref:hypothetical protein n=1 Tax=Streptomyces sp. GbtcB6 TaxID=2824751 RepID=UPI001C30510C|nr:hypothetical protein [Streptomyces sp. GbtcB6]
MPSRVDTYFCGRRPGTPPDALHMTEMAEVVATLFALPTRVEIREIQLSSVHSTFGMFPYWPGEEPREEPNDA